MATRTALCKRLNVHCNASAHALSQPGRPSVQFHLLQISSSLRWPNTVFARAFADAIQRGHKDCKKQTCRQ